MKTAIIFCPFWRQPGHVGNYRVERFIRWLTAQGYKVNLVRGGSKNCIVTESWGSEITIRDPLGLYVDPIHPTKKEYLRRPNKLRRLLSNWIFTPDPGILWSIVAARNPLVMKVAANASFIISSSPPESPHIGAWILSKKFQISHFVDMRDGWIDEPIKPILNSSKIRRKLEEFLEAKILNHAASILVSSIQWSELLSSRIPGLKNKVTVLSNGYPTALISDDKDRSNRNATIINLLHAGRFFGSDARRSPRLILDPLLEILRNFKVGGVIKFVGSLSADELSIIEFYRDPLNLLGWSFECPGVISRENLFGLLRDSEGLLLVSSSYAAVPSKLFEYIPTGKPILVVAEKGSATWQICENLSQVSLIELNGQIDNQQSEKYLRDITSGISDPTVPAEFYEDALANIFYKCINK